MIRTDRQSEKQLPFSLYKLVARDILCQTFRCGVRWECLCRALLSFLSLPCEGEDELP